MFGGEKGAPDTAGAAFPLHIKIAQKIKTVNGKRLYLRKRKSPPSSMTIDIVFFSVLCPWGSPFRSRSRFLLNCSFIATKPAFSPFAETSHFVTKAHGGAFVLGTIFVPVFREQKKEKTNSRRRKARPQTRARLFCWVE